MNPLDARDVETVAAREEPAPGLTQAERVKVFYLLHRKGRSARQIARVVCVTPRTIVRWRRALALTEVGS
jgi:hypothetical protein